ncbi:MAG: aspartate/glutamate racemase family protein [Burkholderiaceae bacterium]
MLTPQANTTVEPEFWALMPPDWSMITARLTSDKDTIAARLADYPARYAAVADEFANAPLSVLAIGCTGTSYLLGEARDREVLADLSARHRVPCLSAGPATVQALRALGARRVGLVSPYPPDLERICLPYWAAAGFEIVAKETPEVPGDSFHPIYAMPGGAALAAARRLRGSGCDAIVMLGTGMATLAAILALRGWDGPVPLSCNLALAWAAVQAGAGQAPDRDNLLRWIAGDGWASRFGRMFAGDGGASH